VRQYINCKVTILWHVICLVLDIFYILTELLIRIKGLNVNYKGPLNKISTEMYINKCLSLIL